MPGPTSLPIEEFLEAVTAQLDKTQDALRLKAVNRPLTFALKDFAIDLNVFIEMNTQGDILFRPSGPNETGASKVQVGFTTITRPMIEENTISMELTQSPSLEEVGLEPEERTRLNRLGVRNAAQLRRLEASAGDSTMSRLSGVNVGRLRDALQLGKPRVQKIETGNGASVDTQEPALTPQSPSPSPSPSPRVERAPAEPPRQRAPDLKLQRGDQKLRLRGRNLIEGGRIPQARLNDRQLKVSGVNESEMTLELPDAVTRDIDTGVLEVHLPDGVVQSFSVTLDRPQTVATESAAGSDNASPSLSRANGEPDDPWLPDGARS